MQPQSSAIHYFQKLLEVNLAALILVNLSLDCLHFIISWIQSKVSELNGRLCTTPTPTPGL